MTGMQSFIFSILVLIIALERIAGQESAQYLQNAVRDLRNLNIRQTLRRADTALVAAAAKATVTPPPQPAKEVSSIDRRIHKPNVVPPLSLTKGELAALYEAAVNKGETIKLDTGDSSYIHAAVHELDDSESHPHHNAVYSEPPASHHSGSPDDSSGYYYYYYPIKSFLDEMTSQPDHHPDIHYHPSIQNEVIHESTHKPHYQYHSHTHQHNVNIAPMKQEMMKEEKKKALEPLFMAISGFIGMAVMFVLSVLVFPKFGIKYKNRDIKKNERIDDIARIALQAIEGGACAERFACELGQTARNFQLQENRFVKLIRRMAPSSFTKHMDKVGRYSNKRIKCTAIPCKKKNNNNNSNQKKKPPQKPHKKF